MSAVFTNFEIMASPSQSKVCFFFDGVRFNLPERTRLKRFIEQLFKKEGKKLGALNYIFCSDEKILQINQQYLDHNFYTDIITFELSPKGLPIEAEAYISYERVKDNARNLGISTKDELKRVIFHGALHLCGYGDKTQREIQNIRKKEDFYLNKYS